MRTLPEPVQNLIDSLARLPGVGPKTASRLAFFLLRAPEDISLSLADALRGIKDENRLMRSLLQHHSQGHPRL